MPTRLLLAVLVLCACGSGLGKKDAKCDLRPSEAQCTDWRDFTGPSLVTIEATCQTLITAQGGGAYAANKRCDNIGTQGGCQSVSADGTRQTNWYYDVTEEVIRTKCDSNQTFVSPD